MALSFALQRRDTDGGTYWGLRFEGPVLTACPRVQRIDAPVGARHENPAAHDSRLAIGNERTGECEGPFQLQLWNFGSGQSGAIGRLKTRVGKIGPPSVPVRGRR